MDFTTTSGELLVVYLSLAGGSPSGGVRKSSPCSAPWLACVSVDGKFVSIFSAFLSLTEAMMYCTWGHLFMGLLTLMASEATW